MTWTWLVAAATLASALLWLSAAGWAVVATRPAPVAADGPTMELRPEPPALVEYLTGGWESGRGAPRATLLDLAARGFLALDQTGPDPRDTLVRIRPPRRGTAPGATAEEDLLPYEALVLARVTALASAGVLPAGALARGTEDEDRGWWRAFGRAVAADARDRGLARDRYPARLKAGLTLAAAAPSALAAVLFVSLAGPGAWFMSLATGLGLWICGSVLVSRLTGERETPAGVEACAHWLGVREWLARDESFPGLPPAAVAVWDRYVAYGAATGVARSALAVLPLGPRDERRAWSTYGGGWHEVRLRYAPAPARALRPPRDSVRLALRRIGSASIVLALVAWWHTHPPAGIRLPVESIALLVVELVLLIGVLMGARWLWTGRRPVIPLAAYVYGGLLAFVAFTGGLQASGHWTLPPRAVWAQLPPVLISRSRADLVPLPPRRLPAGPVPAGLDRGRGGAAAHREAGPPPGARPGRPDHGHGLARTARAVRAAARGGGRTGAAGTGARARLRGRARDAFAAGRAVPRGVRAGRSTGTRTRTGAAAGGRPDGQWFSSPVTGWAGSV